MAAETYRVELAGLPVPKSVTTNRAEAVALAKKLRNRAFVWAIGAKMIVFRNWVQGDK